MIDRPMPGALRPLLLAACLTLAGCGSLLHTPYETPDVTCLLYTSPSPRDS